MDGPPLTPEQRHALDEAEERASSFIGAAKVAAFNGRTFAFLAAVSILFGPLDLPGLLVLGPGAGELFQQITTAAYGVVIGATVLYQGLNARYDHVRIARLEDFLERTPAWVIDVRRSVRR